MDNIIEIQHLSKTFGSNEVLKDIDFSVKKGEVVCIIGSSGSGKSTLLRCINLLEKPSGGQIIYKGENILDEKHDIYAYRTKLGMVFQQFNLFNNYNVLGNCIVGQMKVLKRTREEAINVAMKYLKVVGMDQYINAKPKQLSGGQKQRVAIARALSMEPDVMVFDEPTSALDPLGRREVRQIILDLRRRGKTVFLNSHLLSEVEMICDQVAIIHRGRIIATGVLGEMLSGSVEVEMQVEAQTPQMLAELSALSRKMAVDGSRIRLSLNDREDVGALAGIVVRNGGRLFSLKAVQSSLEDLFVDLIQGGGGNDHAGHNPADL